MIFPSMEAVLQVTSFAIFSGRGGRNQHSPIHQAFLDAKDRLRARYQRTRTNAQKLLLHKELIQWVSDQGGEFFRRNTDGTCEVMTLEEKLKKSAQALRERRKQPRSNPPTIPQVPDYTAVTSLDVDYDGMDEITSIGKNGDIASDENRLPFMNDCAASYNAPMLEFDDDYIRTCPLEDDNDTATHGCFIDMEQLQNIDTDCRTETFKVQRLADRDAYNHDDVVSIASDATADSFELVLQLLDHMMMEEMNDMKDVANEPIAIDFIEK